MIRLQGTICLLILFQPALQLSGQEKSDKISYDRRSEKIAMRDGVKLYTVIHTPKKQTESLPIIMIRTPYNADRPNPLNSYLKNLAEDGYLFVFQDIRGRYQSDGEFDMIRAPRDKSNPQAIDESSDTYDTIEWLIKNVPQNNGRVGMLGISYDGWLTTMALIDPHPALKAGSPQAPVADMYLGDDFHHNGAFRLSYGLEYVTMIETDKRSNQFKFDKVDTYEWYLKLGPLSNVNEKYLKGKMPTWNNFVKHPNYDAFWQKQAASKYMNEVKVPTLTVAGWWDQEDFYGPLTTYSQFEKKDTEKKNFMVVGPWNHGGWAGGDGSSLDKIKFNSPTAQYYRETVQKTFFDKYLKDKGDMPFEEVMTFQTGSNRWVNSSQWPPKEARTRQLYFHEDGKLSFDAPQTAEASDSYVSDPRKPVPYRERPIRPTYSIGSTWSVWLVQDQRFVHNRPDVLSYETEPLHEDTVLAGNVFAKLFASTTGSDCDWIVKLIDVYPDNYSESKMAGYQLMVANDVFRGRFRESFENPRAIEPGKVNEYQINLHSMNHCFRKGHRIMVQIQSTWFPLIDRNPQKFIPNIFEATEKDFQSATHTIHRSASQPSHLIVQQLPK
ncbi:MAG: CocE/NonD family hydrolase [Planctomycetia bacterium]|nr:CocE/NonD family hydrolase [Planctomycetia bacterium]